jgi:hydroxymethylpyrimidine pyrophosphatase-like HAD family hydrolase
MKKIKAILCDFDGTLIDEKGRYLPGVKILIKKILDKNIRFSLATGRAYYSSIKKIEKELDIKGIHIFQLKNSLMKP